MIRSWGVVTLTGSAQPWFGDVLTAAFTVPGDGAPGVVTVASTTRYAIGDRIILGIGQAGANVVIVDRIFSATVLYVHSEGGAALKAWVSTTIIALSIRCFKVVLMGVDGNAATVWLGSDNTVTNVGGGSAFFELQKVAAAANPNFYDYSDANGANALGTADGWMAGTASDKVGVAAYVN